MTASAGHDRFRVRESPLTVALRDPNHRATYSLFWAVHVIVQMVTCFHYYFDRDLMYRDLEMMVRFFHNVHIMFLMEAVCLSVFALILLPSTIWWRRRVLPLPIYGLIVSGTLVAGAVTPVLLAHSFRLHLVLKVATSAQHLRYIFKMISFVVENGNEVERNSKQKATASQEDINNNANCQQDEVLVDDAAGKKGRETNPSLGTLTYFWFAPTLIYQHSYPRSEGSIRWTAALQHILTFLACVPAGVVACRMTISAFEGVGKEDITTDHLIRMICCCFVISVLVFMSLGFCFCHCWMNCWAELLRFGDRGFYKNYWSAPNAFVWMSLWNQVVQTFIKEYAYKPVARITGNRLINVFVTILVSALVHDYSICLFTGFAIWGFFPSIFLVIVPLLPLGFPIYKLSQRFPLPSTNINTFLIFITSFALMILHAFAEYFARVNCPESVYGYVSDFFVPRLLTCASFKL